MAEPVLTAALSGKRAILLSWAFGSNADFQVFWKSSNPPGQEYALLATTNAFSFTTPDLDPSKTYTFYVRANVGVTFFYSNTVELFVSCGKGVVLSAEPPAQPFFIVTDTGNHRLVKLSRDLEWILTAGSFGSGNDNFSSPTHSCIVGGYVFTTDTGNHRIIKRDLANLAYISDSGPVYDVPYGIATDGQHIYITDKGAHRIYKMGLDFSGAGYVCHYGSLNYSERLLEPIGGSFHRGDPIVNTYIDPTFGLASFVIGTLIAGTYHKSIMYAPDGDGFATSVAWQTGPTPEGPWSTYQGYGGGPTVVAAYAYTWAATGQSYVADYSFCPLGGQEHLSSPGGIYCDETNVCILDSGNLSLMKRSPTNMSYAGRVTLLNPPGYHDVSFGSSYLYITSQPDVGQYMDTYFQVARYTYPGLVYVDRKYSSQTTTDGWFTRPEGVFVKGAFVYVIESGNCRIQKFNPDLSYILKFGSAGSGVNQFSGPKGITGI